MTERVVWQVERQLLLKYCWSDTDRQTETDQDYEEALTIFAHEADLFAGIIPDPKTTEQTKCEPDGDGQSATQPEAK